MRARPVFIALAITLAACNMPAATPTPAPATATAFATTQPSPITEPSPTSRPTEPPAPEPEEFGSYGLRGGIVPVGYIADQCAYLQARWDPQGALPGTIVAPIMFHGIAEGSAQPSAAQDINEGYFDQIIATATDLSFETITTEELVAFLTTNAKIPPRSMLLILDDRRPGTAEDRFLPVNEEHGWTTTLAWIAVADTDTRPGRLSGETLWDWVERVVDTGYFDVQSHGRDHIYLQSTTSEEATRTEIEGSLPPLQEHFGVTPVAYIWPGGNYTQLGLDIAHEAGFELGFTVQSRGPLMFNWIPQGEQELEYSDPLLLLPRFWSSAATLNLEQTAATGDAAQAFAQANYAAEAAWFAQNCGSQLPPLDEIFK